MIKLTMCIMICLVFSQLYGMDHDLEDGRQSPTALLHTSVREREWPTVLQALSQGARVNERVTLHDETCMHIATTAKALPVVRALVKHKAHVDWRDYNGVTPLLIASSQQNTDILLYLLSQGADSNVVARRYQQHTPLYTAAAYGTFAAVNLLRLAGAHDVSNAYWFAVRVRSSINKVCMKHELTLSLAGHIEALCSRSVSLKFDRSLPEYQYSRRAAKTQVANMLKSRVYARCMQGVQPVLQDACTLAYLGDRLLLDKYVEAPLREFLLRDLCTLVMSYADETHQTPTISLVAAKKQLKVLPARSLSF